MNKAPEIVILLPGFLLKSGGEESLCDLGVSLSSSGWTVTYGSLEALPPLPKLAAFLKRVSQSFSRARVISLARQFDSWIQPSVHVKDLLSRKFTPLALRFVMTPNRLISHLRFKKFDVVITSQIFSFRGIQQIRARSSAFLVLNYAGEPAELESQYTSRGPTERESYEDYLNLFDLVLFQSPSQMENFQKSHPKNASKVHLLQPRLFPKALDDALCREQPDSFSARTAEVLNITIFGPISPRKGQLLLVSAFSEVVKVFPNVHLTMCGRTDGNQSYLKSVRDLIAANQLGLSASLVGHRNDPLEFLAHSDLLVIASSSEGVPRILREALYLGIPVVSSSLPGVRDFLPDEFYVRFEPRSPDVLAASILECLNDPERASERALRAKAFFHEGNTASRYSEDVENLGKRLLAMLQSRAARDGGNFRQ